MEDNTTLPREIKVDEDYNHYLKQRMCDKAIADCVEALIGAYLTCLGTDPTIKLMKWLGLKVDVTSHVKAPIDCLTVRQNIKYTVF